MTIWEQMFKTPRLCSPIDIVYHYGFEIAFLYGVIEWLTYQGDSDRKLTASDIAQVMKKSEKWVRRQLHKMEKYGLIRLEGKAGKGYYIHLLYVDKSSVIVDKKSVSDIKTENTSLDKMSTISGQIFRNMWTKSPQYVDKMSVISGQNVRNDPSQSQSQTAFDGRLINNNKNNKDNKGNKEEEDKEEKSATASLTSAEDTPREEETFGKEKALGSKAIEPIFPELGDVQEKKQKSRRKLSRPNITEEQIQAVVEAYKELCTNMPQVKKVTDKRRRMIRKLLKHFTLEEIREAYKKANNLPFLLGHNDRGWRANFDFMIDPEKLARVIEGKYDKVYKKPQPPQRPVQPAPAVKEEPDDLGLPPLSAVADRGWGNEVRTLAISEVMETLLKAQAPAEEAGEFSIRLVDERRPEDVAIYRLIKQGLTWDEAHKKVG